MMRKTAARNEHAGGIEQSIVACCTASGSAALGLIRVSGSNAMGIVDAVSHLPGKRSLVDVDSHSIVYGFITDEKGDHLDQVLFLVTHAPRTFTGQHTVEITCHNNRFIIDAIISRLCAAGARQARAGEFTQRAVENGKIDMLQAEALHDLITAPSRALAQTSLSQLEGSLSHVVASIEEELIAVAGLVETSFEFSEEEHMDLDFDRMVIGRLQGLIDRINQMTAQQNNVDHLKQGIRIALVGSVNAGKSTLLNALLGRNRAIVSDQAGTTRDSIEASMSDGLYSWTFIDTAGLRETDDRIEKEGIERSREAAYGADIVLLVIDGSRVIDEATRAEYDALIADHASKTIVVYTKAELEQVAPYKAPEQCPGFVVSAQTKVGMDAFTDALHERVAALYQAADTPFVLNQRHIALLSDLQRDLTTIAKQLTGTIAYELVAAQLHDSLALVTQLAGRSINEKVMDQVFSTFCIGK